MENNKLIAEFMGVPCDKDLYTPLCPHTGETLFIPSSQMKYDTSWDWLMPVIAKCTELNDDEFDNQSIAWALLSDSIVDAYDHVVEFIKEYNNGK